MDTKIFIREAAGEIFSWPEVHDVGIEKRWGQVHIKVRFGFKRAWTWHFSESDIANSDNALDLLTDMQSHIADAVNGPIVTW